MENAPPRRHGHRKSQELTHRRPYANSILVVPARLGDANLDGTVDFADFVTLSNHFGTNAGPYEVAAASAVSGVPETVSLVLLGLGLLGAFGRRRRGGSIKHKPPVL